MGINYGSEGLPKRVTEIPMPLLDDPVVHAAIFPNFNLVLNSFAVAFYWLTGVYILFVGWTVIGFRNETVAKPRRVNARISPVELDKKYQKIMKAETIREDFVYASMRRMNAAVTGRMAVDSPTGYLTI